MFTPTPEQLASDWADREVDFGGYVYSAHFDRHATNFVGFLPRRPPPSANYDAGERCLCPSCKSEGWYAGSPLCKFWRASCWMCHGQREYRIPESSVKERCAVCDEAWVLDVRFFRDALRSPRRVAAQLRAASVRARAEYENN